MNREYRSNFIKYMIRSCLYTASYMFAVGTMIQTFLAYLGVSSGTIGLHSSLINIVNVITTMLYAGIADKSRDIKRKTMLCMLPYAFLFLGYLPLCLISGISAGAAFAVVLMLSVLQMIFLSIYGIYGYKLPYQIFDVRHYGLIMSLEMVIGGIFSVAVSFVINLVFAAFEEKYVFFGAFLVCVLFGLGAALMSRELKVKSCAQPSAPAQAPKRYTLKELARLPVFSKLIVSNFARGLATGFLNISAGYALLKHFTGTQVSYLVTAASIATLAGGAIYAAMSRWVSNKTLCLAGGLMHIFMFLMPMGAVPLFLVCYFLAYVGKIIVDTAVPALLYEVVPFEMSGAYNAWRMILTTAGAALASGVGGYLAENIPIPVILVFAAACQVFSSLLYYKDSWRRAAQQST